MEIFRRDMIVGFAVGFLWMSSGAGHSQTSSFGPRASNADGYRSKYTYPQPAKMTVAKDVQAPGAFIPTNPERYRWTVSNEINGTPTTTGKVTLYALVAGKLSPAATIDPGTEVKLGYVRAAGKLLYYGIPWSKEGQVDSLAGGTPQAPRFLAWIPGNYIRGAPLSP